MNAPLPEYEYDVAMSFIAKDEPLAHQIAEELIPLQVFLYSKAQEKIAGRDGLEAFREVFRYRARLALVLYRSPWGETPWTRVEDTAIRDHCLEQGWRHLFFVFLDRDSPKPPWVPDSYIYLDLTTFTIADLVGAVKARCQELGAQLRAPSPAERAAQIARRERFDKETTDLLQRDSRPFHEAAEALFAAIERHCVEIEKSTGWEIRREGDSHEYYVVFCRGFTLQLLPKEVYANRADGAFFGVRRFRGRILTPGERREGLHVWGDPPKEVSGGRPLQIHREPELGWCWRLGHNTLTHETAAERLIQQLVDSVVNSRRRDL